MKKRFCFFALIGLTLSFKTPVFCMQRALKGGSVLAKKNGLAGLVLNRYYACDRCQNCSCKDDVNKKEIQYVCPDGELKIYERVIRSEILRADAEKITNEHVLSLEYAVEDQDRLKKFLGLIEVVDLSYSRITFKSVKFLLDNCPNLETIYLDGCILLPEDFRQTFDVKTLREFHCFNEQGKKKEELL